MLPGQAEGAPAELVKAAHPSPSVKMKAVGLSVWYGAKEALKQATLDIPTHQVTALIGPSGCGKSTFLRSLNRMNDTIDGARVEGCVLLDGVDIYAAGIDAVTVRRHVGMVFQRPNPFPKSIFDNVAYGLRLAPNVDRDRLRGAVERALRQAALWEEVKDRLDQSALALSGGQQQRLCIARALAVEPQVLLLDEPASALDPIATAKIEELISELAGGLTVVIVTHNMQQAARVSQRTAFFYMGRLVEAADTPTLFNRPKSPETADYVGGRFG